MTTTQLARVDTLARMLEPPELTLDDQAALRAVLEDRQRIAKQLNAILIDLPIEVLQTITNEAARLGLSQQGFIRLHLRYHFSDTLKGLEQDDRGRARLRAHGKRGRKSGGSKGGNDGE
jgi:hypothetical protein